MTQQAQSHGSRVVFKSKSLTGIMAESYFDLATPDHFWCRRRFDVLRKLAGDRLQAASRVGEIGCGNGVLQLQLEDAYPLAPDGFDLHEGALRRNMSRRGGVYCYDINDRAEEFRNVFDVILMFDVLEHIEDEDRFLQSARFHLAGRGSLIINVPALQWLFSAYDEVQGHQRRYSVSDLAAVARRNGFRVHRITYWGGPLVPVLALRKVALTLARTRLDNYAAGFDSKGELMNAALYAWSRLELIPQRFAGTSVMAVLEPES